MTRQQLLLAILASAQGRPFSPVQLQKATFLVTKNIRGIVTKGARFHFVPYDYGPFDLAVYSEAEQLAGVGGAAITQ